MSKKTPTTIEPAAPLPCEPWLGPTEGIEIDGPTEPLPPLGEPWKTLQNEPDPTTSEAYEAMMAKSAKFAPPEPQPAPQTIDPATDQLIARLDLLHELAARSISDEKKLGYEAMHPGELFAALVRNASSGSWVHVVAYAAMLAQVGATKDSLKGYIVAPAGQFIKLQNDLTEALDKIDAKDAELDGRRESLKARDQFIDRTLADLGAAFGPVPPIAPAMNDAQAVANLWTNASVLIQSAVTVLGQRDALLSDAQHHNKMMELNLKDGEKLRAENAALKTRQEETADLGAHVLQQSGAWQDQAETLAKVLLQVTKN